jgi:hypothetical protein
MSSLAFFNSTALGHFQLSNSPPRASSSAISLFLLYLLASFPLFPKAALFQATSAWHYHTAVIEIQRIDGKES